MKIWGKNILRRRNCNDKVPEKGMGLVCSSNSKGTVWLGYSG